MKRLIAFADKTKYFVLIFLALVINMFLAIGEIKLPHTYAVSYSMFLLDYSFGFCARFFPGQLYKWITGGNYNPKAVENFMRVELLIVFVLIALLLSWFIRSAPEGSRKHYIILALFYVSGPTTFSLYSYGLGVIDTLWVIFTPLFIILLLNKYTRFIAPVLVIPMVLVHFSVVTCYMILIFFILLYLASAEKEKKNRIIYASLFAVCFVLSVGLTVYFIKYESVNIKYSAEEMMEKIMERSQIGENTDLLYVNFDIFKTVKFNTSYSLFDGVEFPFDNLKDDILIPPDSTSLPSFLVNAINAVWPNLDFHIHYYFSKGRAPDEIISILKQTVFNSPVIAFIFMYWHHRINIAKEEKNHFQRLLFIMAIVYFPAALIFWFAFSIDFFRYFNHIMIVEGAFMLFVMYLNPEDTKEWLKTQFGKSDKRFFLLYSAIYFMSGTIGG